MKELSLADALRYLVVGLIALGFLYVCDRDLAVRILTDMGTAEAILWAFAIGTIFYLVYRPILYYHVIIHLQDAARVTSHNYRTYLRERYDTNTYTAQLLWIYVRNQLFTERMGHLYKEASGNHLTYMSGIIALGFAVWQFLVKHWGSGIAMLIAATVLGLAAFLHDRFIEDYEYELPRSISDDDLDGMANTFGIKKR